jgi:Predicted nucleic-acid-binding protein, contains PIN domain
MKTAPALVDTNILCYAFDTHDEKKRDRAKELLERCWRSKERLSVSVQNLAEFSMVVTEKVERPLPLPVVRKFIASISSFDGWNVVGYSSDTILAAHEIKKRWSLHFWDALLVATMEENRIHAIYTEDRHFDRVPGLSVIDPVAE